MKFGTLFVIIYTASYLHILTDWNFLCLTAVSIDNKEHNLKLHSFPDFCCLSLHHSTHVIRPQTQYIKQCTLICMYNAENVLKLLKYHDQDLTLDNLVEKWMHRDLEKAKGFEPEPKNRAMMVLKLTEWLELTAALLKVL